MTKIEIISDIDGRKFRDGVNKFIADKNVIDIKYQSYPISYGNTGEILDRAIIIYQEQETSFWEDALRVMDDMTLAQKREAIKYLKERLDDDGCEI